MKELPDEILCAGSCDDESGVYVSQEDLKRRLYYGWTLQDIIDFETNKKAQQ